MAKSLTVDVLHRLAQLVAGDSNVDAIPGPTWYGDSVLRKVVYPPEALVQMDEDDAVGKLWRSAEHVKHSISDEDDYESALDRIVDIDTMLGNTLLHPHWVMRLLAIAERQRVTPFPHTPLSRPAASINQS